MELSSLGHMTFVENGPTSEPPCVKDNHGHGNVLFPEEREERHTLVLQFSGGTSVPLSHVTRKACDMKRCVVDIVFARSSFVLAHRCSNEMRFFRCC